MDEALKYEKNPCPRTYRKNKVEAHGPHLWQMQVGGGPMTFFCPGLKAHPNVMIGKGNK